MRAREVRERLRGKIEPDVMYVLEALAEDNAVLREQILTTAQVVDEIINQLGQLHGVIESAQSTVDKLRGKEWQGEDPDAP